MKRLKIIPILLLTLALTLPRSTTSQSQNEMFNMSYIFFGSPSTYITQVDKTKGSLDVVSPNYFDITEQGTLAVTWRLQSSFIDEMHRRGIKVVPFLANHWNKTAGINGLNNRVQLAKDVAAAVERYNLDGVNVDIEGIGSTYRDAHTDFIRLLRQNIPAHKEVSVAVAANPNGWKTGWHGFYDYNALGNIANYLMIMAYDESWESPDSPVGTVSSISFFERSVQYAINQGVPKDRIVVGLPFYGRMWKLDGPTLEGKSITGKGLSSTSVGPLVEQFNGKIGFDEDTQSSYATFTIPPNQNAYVGSTNLTAGDYLVWFENERSIKAKLRVPGKYGIKGTGSWALYHETADTWDYYSLWLNSRYFADVSSGYWAADSINVISEKGWMTGTSSTAFSPTKTLTRAEAAVIIVRALGQEDVVPEQFVFKDTVGHWAREEIEIARQLGYLEGRSATKFDPNASIRRDELAKILYNIFDFPITQVEEPPFPDIETGVWSYDAIVALYQQGYLTGFKDGKFRPTATSSRGEMAALIERMVQNFEAVRSG